MSHSTNTRNERRTGNLDRRAGAERRGTIRHCNMEADSRNNAPRRQSDVTNMMADGKIWWSGV